MSKRSTQTTVPRGRKIAGSAPASSHAALELAAWFDRQKRVLPWRDLPTLYRVWVSEIMLQQTQVVTVKPYFERFIAKFPTVHALAIASEEDVLLQWAGLGYYSRARNLHRGSKMIEERGFPKTREAWLEIPGVGAYTAGAILSIALDQPEAILDGNVERVLSRINRVSRSDGDAVYKARLWELSSQWVREAHSAKIAPSVTNQALMELGAMICTPKNPKCAICPVRDFCEAHEHSEESLYPPKKKPKVWISVKEELHCVFDSQGRVLVRQRGKGEWRAGLWDLLADFSERKARRIGAVDTKHVVTRHKIARHTHVWAWDSPSLRAAESDGFRWISVENPTVPVGSALKRTLQEIRERFPEALR